MAKRVEESHIETYYFSDTSFNLLMQNRITKSTGDLQQL